MLKDQKARSLSYTLIGERPNCLVSSKALTIVLLMREGAPVFREDLFKFLSEFPFVLEIIVIERNASLDLEGYVRRFCKVRFLLMENVCSVGEKVNAAVLEAVSDYAFVVWSDVEIQNPFWFSSFLEDMKVRKHLCVVPQLLNKDGESLPCVHVPAFHEDKLKVLDLESEEGGNYTLYPHDYIGLYSRSRFIALGGFDLDISSAYWQKLDFGIRAFAWAETISVSRKMKFKYLDTSPVESLCEEGGYDLFFLKNYWPCFDGDHVEMSFGKFFKLIRPSSLKLKDIFRRYFYVRNWLYQHRYRFKKDLKGVIELWGNTDSM